MPSVRIGSEIFHRLRRELMAAGHQTNVGDEGGFVPNVASACEALDYIMRSIEKAGYEPGVDVAIVLDPAPSEFWKDGAYHYGGENWFAQSIRMSPIWASLSATIR